LNELEKAYLAGFLDGEGTISLRLRTQYGKQFFTPIVSLCSTDKDIIDWATAVIGYGSVQYKSKEKENNKACYWTRLRGINSIETFILDVFPYIHMKRKKKLAVLMLEWITLHKKTKNEQHPSVKKGEKFKFSEREYEIMAEMIELNRRGVK
jgi:hypothetical protein